MNTYQLTEINIYPVKSMSGIRMNNAGVTETGLRHDRNWMLVDSEDKFISQRTHPQLALIKTKLHNNKLILSHKTKDVAPLVIPINSLKTEVAIVNVWDDLVEAKLVGKYADEWLRETLDMKCRMVFMENGTQRFVDRNYAVNNEIVSFADAFPFMVIGQASLDDLNSRLDNPLPMNRFRPNFVFSGGVPYEEDDWKLFKIGDILFYGVKPCSRCVTTTIDQDTSEAGKEPLKTLSGYRAEGNKVKLGMNLIHDGTGTIKEGDVIEVLERHSR